MINLLVQPYYPCDEVTGLWKRGEHPLQGQSISSDLREGDLITDTFSGKNYSPKSSKITEGGKQKDQECDIGTHTKKRLNHYSVLALCLCAGLGVKYTCTCFASETEKIYVLPFPELAETMIRTIALFVSPLPGSEESAGSRRFVAEVSHQVQPT